ncbi:hypothetical protein IWX65_003091 [Arthrobacter sp. CAN_A214]
MTFAFSFRKGPIARPATPTMPSGTTTQGLQPTLPRKMASAPHATAEAGNHHLSSRRFRDFHSDTKALPFHPFVRQLSLEKSMWTSRDTGVKASFRQLSPSQ